MSIYTCGWCNREHDDRRRTRWLGGYCSRECYVESGAAGVEAARRAALGPEERAAEDAARETRDDAEEKERRAHFKKQRLFKWGIFSGVYLVVILSSTLNVSPTFEEDDFILFIGATAVLPAALIFNHWILGDDSDL